MSKKFFNQFGGLDKRIILLLLLGILIFGVRLGNINEAIYDDESNYAYSVTMMDDFGFNHDHSSVQPLNILYKPFVAVFGLETWVFRLIPWLFGIINTIFVYFFARKNWGEKVAFWATFLMLFAFYPTLASLQFDAEGSLIMFSILLLLFSFLEYEKASSKGKKFAWQFLAGIGLGVSVFAKYNAVYIVMVLAIYSLIKRRGNIWSSFKDLFPVYFIGLSLFFSLVLLAFITSPNDWLNFIPIFSWSTSFDDKYHKSLFSLLGLAIYLLWSTPLLFGFYVASFFGKIKKYLLPFVWITIALLNYTFWINYGSLDRYLMNTIPALAILGGYFITKVNLQKKHFVFGSFALVLFTGFLFWLNNMPIKYLARSPALYLEQLKGFTLNFLFVYTSASGPTFGVNFAALFWAFIIAFAFLFFYFVFSRLKKGFKKGSVKWLFTGFLFVALAFNIFLISEYVFHPTGVDVSKVKWKMIDYVQDNLGYPVYTNDQGIQWYFEHDYWHKYDLSCGMFDKTVGFADNEVGVDPTSVVINENIKYRGGNIILLHWPPLPEDSQAWQVVGMCEINKKFYDKGILVGEVYVCPKKGLT